jgi:hypothetical protein
VKFNGRLSESVETIKALRRRSLDRGYDEFRLVVVSAPHETDVHIEGLDKRLLEHLRRNPSDALKNAPHGPWIEDLSDLEIDSISITADGTRVTGNAVVKVGEPRTFKAYNNIPLLTCQWLTDFPLSFEIKLDNELRISDVYKVDVDTSTWAD